MNLDSLSNEELMAIAGVSPSGGAPAGRDRDLMIRTVIGEAAQEPFDGQVGVARVIRNRLDSGRYGKSAEDVLFAPKQFEPWQTRSRELMAIRPDSPEYQRAAMAVEAAYSDAESDPTRGALNFANVDTVRDRGNISAMRWINDMQGNGSAVRIGRHTFGTPGARPGANLDGEGIPATAYASLSDDRSDVGDLTRLSDAELLSMAGLSDPSARNASPEKASDIFEDRFKEAPATAGSLSRAAMEKYADKGKRSKTETAALFGLQGVLQSGLDEAAGGLNAAYDYVTGQAPNGFGAAYNRHRASANRILAANAADNPNTATVAEIGGNITSGVAVPGGVVGGLGRRMATGLAAGAGTAGVNGFLSGDGIGDRLTRMGNSAAFGAGFGAGTPVAMAAARKVIGAPLAAAANTVRGLVRPGNEAERRVATALARDAQNGAAGVPAASVDGISPGVVADMGGETTRALARSAANTSTEAREALVAATEDRAKAQGERFATYFDDQSAMKGQDAGQVLYDMQTRAAAANRPAYQKAYKAGEAGIWDDEIARLMESPTFRQAVKDVETVGKDRAVAEGYKPVVNPFVFADDGSVSLKRGATPNLQFWDEVKKNLDGTVNKAFKSGDNGTGISGRAIRDKLRNHLDGIVPEYQAARAGAHEAFGAEDAFEAGQKLFKSNMPLSEVQRNLAKMKPAERALMKEGLIAQTKTEIAAIKDNRDLGKIFLASPRARDVFKTVLGPKGTDDLIAQIRVEQAYQKLNAAVSGNSKTAQYMQEIGMAGSGAGLGWYSGGGTGAFAGAIAGAGLRRGNAYVDQRVAKKVGELLSSNNPADVQRLVGLVRDRPHYRQMVSRFIERPTAQQAGVGGANSGMFGGSQALAGQSEEEQQRQRQQGR